MRKVQMKRKKKILEKLYFDPNWRKYNHFLYILCNYTVWYNLLLSDNPQFVIILNSFQIYSNLVIKYVPIK